MAEWWTKTSGPSPSCSMNPNPLSALNHFTLPVGMYDLLRGRTSRPAARLARSGPVDNADTRPIGRQAHELGSRPRQRLAQFSVHRILCIHGGRTGDRGTASLGIVGPAGDPRTARTGAGDLGHAG